MPELKPRYNIAPSQMVACVRNAPENSHRECVMLKWGLIPSWAKDSSIGHKLIQARSESVAEKPTFKKAFQSRRCLVIADGFYEWKREGKIKQSYYIRFKDRRTFTFAGLWERWKMTEPATGSCSLITTTPNSVMEPIHDRMPVIIEPHNYELWLDPIIQDLAALQPLLAPIPPDEMEAYPVSTMINNPQYDQPECLDPLE